MVWSVLEEFILTKYDFLCALEFLWSNVSLWLGICNNWGLRRNWGLIFNFWWLSRSTNWGKRGVNEGSVRVTHWEHIREKTGPTRCCARSPSHSFSSSCYTMLPGSELFSSRILVRTILTMLWIGGSEVSETDYLNKSKIRLFQAFSFSNTWIFEPRLYSFDEFLKIFNFSSVSVIIGTVEIISYYSISRFL